MTQQKPTALKIPDWEKIARSLWDLLDNISTFSDQHKPEHTPYIKAVHDEAEKRNQYMHSPDGRELVPTEKDIP